MTDMIAAEPAVAGRILDRLPAPARRPAAGAIRAALAAGAPVVVTGCGTSEHGASAVAEILREAAAGAGLAGRTRSPPRRSSCRWTRRRAGW